jgi:hypothetical protein
VSDTLLRTVRPRGVLTNHEATAKQSFEVARACTQCILVDFELGTLALDCEVTVIARLKQRMECSHWYTSHDEILVAPELSLNYAGRRRTLQVVEGTTQKISVRRGAGNHGHLWRLNQYLNAAVYQTVVVSVA